MGPFLKGDNAGIMFQGEEFVVAVQQVCRLTAVVLIFTHLTMQNLVGFEQMCPMYDWIYSILYKIVTAMWAKHWVALTQQDPKYPEKTFITLFRNSEQGKKAIEKASQDADDLSDSEVRMECRTEYREFRQPLYKKVTARCRLLQVFEAVRI